MLSRSPRIAAVAQTHDTRRKSAAPSRAAHPLTYIFGVPRTFFVLGISAMLSLFAHADMRQLVNDGKVTWGDDPVNPMRIYLNGTTVVGTNTIDSAALYDNLVLVYTNTLTTGTLTLDDSVRANARILLVGGGGAGGSATGSNMNCGAGGGGGAGGFIDTTHTLTGGVYTINVGTGGVATAAKSALPGGNGGSSWIRNNGVNIFEAFGGGGGGAACAGLNGASGGGGSQKYASSTSTPHNGGTNYAGQGNAGGRGSVGRSAGGGGGAGSNGGDSRGSNIGGIGGDGLPSSILLDSAGNEIYYAGGGGAGTRNQVAGNDRGNGGLGGGGTGGGDTVASPGDANSGGGGGGGTLTTAGANGGSGVVIVRITQLVETKVALPTISPITFDKSNHVALDFGIAYTYVEGSGETNATDVGNYSFRVTPGPDLEWNAEAGGGTGERTINWSITKRLLNKPEAVTNLVYDGTAKIGVTYADTDLTEYCTFDASSVTNAINGGTYTYSVSLNDKDNTAWKDNTTDDVNGSWTIAPQKVAVPTPKTDLVYDGNEKQGFDSLDYEHYELTSGVTNATAGGAHQFEFSLLGNGSAVNYVWDTDPVSSELYSGEWIIAAAANSVTKPVLEGWRLGTTPNVPTATALYGDVKYAYVFGEDIGNVADWVYSTSAINTDGVWTVIAMVDASANWTGATNSSQFAMWDDPVKLFRDHVDIKVMPPAGTTETFENFVALVKISEDRFYGFEYARAGSDGNKLMFHDSNKNTLPFDVDTWRTTGESLVWVLIPELPPAGTTITMYWNLKEGRTAPPNNPEEVWPFYSGVWHMNESITSSQASTALSYDSTTNKNNATPTKGGSGNLNQMVSREGRIGNARVNSTVAPVTQGNRLQTARTQAFNGVFTFSGWFLMNARGSYPRFAGTKAGASGSAHGWSVETKQNSSTLLFVRGDGGSTWDDNGNGIPVDDMLNNWVYLTFVYNNNKAAIYSNGKISKTASITKVVDSTQPLSFGAHGSGEEWSLNGAYDEIRITGQALSAQRIAAEYATVVSNDFTVQGSAVSRDDVKRNYWVSLPAMDKTDWDVTETPGAITNAGQLAFCGVTNYIYSVYDPTRTFASTADLTEVGYYRIVFLPDDSEGYEPISHTIEIHVVEGQPYSGIVGNNGDSGRILLMNNHTWSKTSVTNVDYQGWFDADNAGANKSDTSTYWHHENLDAPSATGFNLQNGTESVLYAADGRRLWHIANCRHGNTFPNALDDGLQPLQNYLSWNATYSRSILDHSLNRRTGLQTVANRSTVGQVVMQNTTDAVVYSSCFTNGIGTIYFDAVNGWKPLSDEERGYYNLVFEIATNTVEGLVPTDINCVTYTIEKDPETEQVTEIITNWYGNLENCWHAVPVIPYKRDGTTNFEKGVKTEELALDVENGGTMNNFFRVVVPLDIAGPVRFRIRRTSVDTRYGADVSAFILLDNIIASIPAMRGDLISAGHYSEAKIGSQAMGWELAANVPYPSIADTNIIGRAKPVFTLNIGDGSEPDTNKFFSSATMHYRWRYLNQTTNQEVSAWKDIALNPGDNFKAIRPLELPSRPGDVEYWFEYRSQAPFYKYVDYSGASNALIDYTEDRGVLTNKLNAVRLESCGTDWFFRIRDGKSEYSEFDIVYRRGDSTVEERSHMTLVDNHVWRGFVQTLTNQTGTIKYRIEALNRQTDEFAEYTTSTNYMYCAADNPPFPVSDSLVEGSDESWSTLTLDATTGYVMFQIDDGITPHSLTIVHADYQNFNLWSDARKSIFVGNSTEDNAKVGTSPRKRTFVQDFDKWNPMPATNVKWQFSSFADTQYMLGRTAYVPFASDSDGLWSVGPGMWVSKKYMVSTNNAGVALQMEGNGKGYLQFTDKDSAPRGLESITFNARLGQFIRFDDFAYYYAENLLNISNYTFMTRTAFDTNSNNGFDGNASLSLVANYLPNKGCYEARWEWLGKTKTNDKGGQRICIYRWNVTPSGAKSAELIVARTNLTGRTNNPFDVPTVTSLSAGEKFLPMFISVSNDVPNNCTYVVAAVRRTGLALGWSPLKDETGYNIANNNYKWFGVSFKDTDASKRLTRGSYGVLSANCDGVFARPEFSHTVQYVSNKATDTFELAQLAQIDNLQNIKNCANDDLRDADYPGWNIIPGRLATCWIGSGSTAVGGVISAPVAQDLQIFLGTAGSDDWDPTPYATIPLNTFGGKPFSEKLYTTKDCSVKFAVAGSIDDVRTDVVIDSVSLKQWCGEDYANLPSTIIPDWIDPYEDSESNPGYGMTNWIFTSAWTTNTIVRSGANVTTNGMLLLSAKRTRQGSVSSIRSPLMDNYNMGYGNRRGTGLGMVSYDYENAQANARLFVQIATNNVNRSRLADWDEPAPGSWTTIATNDFSKMSAEERKKGTISVYIGLHGVKGLMRVVVDPALVESVATVTDPERFGEVLVGKVVCRDEPPIDSGCWWGWNMRTIGTTDGVDKENKMYLPDFALDSEAVGMSLALNNSVTADVDESDAETYKQNVPFVQTPTFTSNIVGEVAFKARRYDTNLSQPASVALYGMDMAGGTETWHAITNFIVTASTYEYFSYKTDPGKNYAAFRLGVSGVDGVPGSGPVVPEEYENPVRVLIDEVFICEAVRARMSFRNVGAFRSKLSDAEYVPNVPSIAEQPLCNEGWGVECEVFAAQLENEIDLTRKPSVILHWFEGTEPWGFENWKDKTSREGHRQAPLAPATGTNLVYRSSYLTAEDAVVPMSTVPGTVIQYMLEVRYFQVGSSIAITNWLSRGSVRDGWERPYWYRGVDYNADLGGNRKENFAAYNILDTVPPGWAWINEVNIYGLYDDNWKNDEEDAQFVEIAVPVESDISGWEVRLLGANTEDRKGTIVTNVIATFGTSELPGMKPSNLGEASRMVFRVVACPKALTSGTLKEADGTLDTTWDFSRNYTDTFQRNGQIMEVDSFGIQLVRPSKIIEHEITCIGTNYYGSMPGYEQYYSPTNTVEYFRKYMRDSSMFYAGEDSGNRNAADEFRSLGVFQGNGATSNEWNNTMKRTPGRINEDQTINSDLRPTPNGESILVFCSLDPTVGHIRQTVGDAVETNTTQTIYLKRGSENGTNIVYTVDKWYELASVTTNGQPAAFSPLAEPRKYVVTVGVGASNNVSVIASAKIENRLVGDFGLTEDNPYTPAILDWLEQGVDLYGNPWPNRDSSEIKLADFIRPDNSIITNLNLTQMYWLDMDPTIGNLALKGYISDGPALTNMAAAGGVTYTNLRFDIFMQITNRASADAWAPYALRGLEPGSSSFGFTNRTTATGWTSATFKMVGIIDNGHTGFKVRDNWVPLRWFVFAPNSFRKPGSAKPFTSTIWIVDPFSKSSPAWEAGWYEWAQEHGKPQDFYFWCLDERLEPIAVEVLKEDNPCD